MLSLKQQFLFKLEMCIESDNLHFFLKNVSAFYSHSVLAVIFI